MKNYTLHLIRHGMTLGNEQGKYIGITDEPLSENGRSQLLEICDHLHYPDVQVVYSSPMLRCKETTEIIYPNTFMKTVNDIREYDFGVFENKSMEELKDTPEFKVWAEGGMIDSPANGENKADFDLRIQNGLKEIISDMMKNNITSAAVITHSGIIAALLAKYGLPQKNPIYWTVQNGCGYTVTTSAYLWGSGETFEIMDRLPIDLSAERFNSSYDFCDIDDEDSDNI